MKNKIELETINKIKEMYVYSNYLFRIERQTKLTLQNRIYCIMFSVKADFVQKGVFKIRYIENLE